VPFTGQHEHTIDAKHRLAIPAEIRAAMDSKTHGEAFYLVPGANGHLWLWPEKTFNRMTRAYESSLLGEEELMEFEETLYSDATHLPIDSANRIRLPDWILAEHGLGERVMVLGIKDHLELRDPAEWKATRAEKRARWPEIMRKARQALKDQTRPTDSSNGEMDRP
jgi:MraZ protein